MKRDRHAWLLVAAVSFASACGATGAAKKGASSRPAPADQPPAIPTKLIAGDADSHLRVDLRTVARIGGEHAPGAALLERTLGFNVFAPAVQRALTIDRASVLIANNGIFTAEDERRMQKVLRAGPLLNPRPGEIPGWYRRFVPAKRLQLWLPIRDGKRFLAALANLRGAAGAAKLVRTADDKRIARFYRSFVLAGVARAAPDPALKKWATERLADERRRALAAGRQLRARGYTHLLKGAGEAWIAVAVRGARAELLVAPLGNLANLAQGVPRPAPALVRQLRRAGFFSSAISLFTSHDGAVNAARYRAFALNLSGGVGIGNRPKLRMQLWREGAAELNKLRRRSDGMRPRAFTDFSVVAAWNPWSRRLTASWRWSLTPAGAKALGRVLRAEKVKVAALLGDQRLRRIAAGLAKAFPPRAMLATGSDTQRVFDACGEVLAPTRLPFFWPHALAWASEPPAAKWSCFVGGLRKRAERAGLLGKEVQIALADGALSLSFSRALKPRK